MLTGQAFNVVIKDKTFQKRLCLVFIDECHLVEEQGSGFRTCYKAIGDLRARLPTSTPWVAVSATLPPGQSFGRVTKSLGFQPHRYIHDSLPIDNTHICYIPQFFSHPVSGTAFLDLSWIIPSTVKSAVDITKTLVFCESIALGTRVYKFLSHLLPQSLKNDIILSYHSIISDDGRSRAMERFRLGTTQIIVASDCFTWGVDVPDVRNVILFGLPSSFSKLVQQIGRVGRDKEQAYAITYAPPWVKVPSDSAKVTKLMAAEAKRRDEMCPVLYRWFNPTPTSCPRDVLCHHFGDTPSHPHNCCILHNKNLPHMEPEPSRIATFTPPRTRGPTVHSDGTYSVFGKEDAAFQLSASRMISAWTRKAWARVSTQNTPLPPTSFLSQALQDHLCRKLHTITSVGKLATVLAGWPRLDQYKEELFQFCAEVLKELDALRNEHRKDLDIPQAEAKEANKPLKIRIKPPQVAPSTVPSKTGRDESDGDPLVGEQPNKKHCGEFRMVV